MWVSRLMLARASALVYLVKKTIQHIQYIKNLSRMHSKCGEQPTSSNTTSIHGTPYDVCLRCMITSNLLYVSRRSFFCFSLFSRYVENGNNGKIPSTRKKNVCRQDDDDSFIRQRSRWRFIPPSEKHLVIECTRLGIVLRYTQNAMMEQREWEKRNK